MADRALRIRELEVVFGRLKPRRPLGAATPGLRQRPGALRARCLRLRTEAEATGGSVNNAILMELEGGRSKQFVAQRHVKVLQHHLEQDHGRPWVLVAVATCGACSGGRWTTCSCSFPENLIPTEL